MSRRDRDRKREEEEEWEAVATPRQRLVRALLPYFAVLAFLTGLGMVSGSGSMSVPVLAVGIFWGLGIASAHLRRVQAAAARGALPEPSATPTRALESGGETVATPAAPSPTASPAAPPVPPLPESLAELRMDVERLGVGLRRHARGKVAETVERGLVEVARLAVLSDVAAVEPDAEALTGEIAALRARAAATGDPEAAALWQQNARAAERRLDKVLALSAAVERTTARIEAYRQTVKSLAIDVARLELVGEAAADLPAVDAHAAAVELEVEALTRTHAELARLERGEPTAAARAPDADDAAERARRARAAQRNG